MLFLTSKFLSLSLYLPLSLKTSKNIMDRKSYPRPLISRQLSHGHRRVKGVRIARRWPPHGRAPQVPPAMLGTHKRLKKITQVLARRDRRTLETEKSSREARRSSVGGWAGRSPEGRRPSCGSFHPDKHRSGPGIPPPSRPPVPGAVPPVMWPSPATEGQHPIPGWRGACLPAKRKLAKRFPLPAPKMATRASPPHETHALYSAPTSPTPAPRVSLDFCKSP